MKNNEVKNHFLYVFQQKTFKLTFTSYTFEYLTVKQTCKYISKSFSDVKPKRTKKKQVCDISQTCFYNKIIDSN